MRFVSVWYSSPTHGQPSNLLSGHRSSSKNSFTYWTIYYYKRFIIWRHISSSKLLYLYHLPDSIGILSKGKLREKRLTEFHLLILFEEIYVLHLFYLSNLIFTYLSIGTCLCFYLLYHLKVVSESIFLINIRA